MMRLRDLFGIVIMAAILQFCIGLLVYGPFWPQEVELHSVWLAIFVMTAVSMSVAAILYWISKRFASERAIKVAILALKDDEQKVVRAILDSGGEVRQDALVKRLDFSRPKLTEVINHLENKRIVIKVPYGRTNLLRVSEEFAG